MFKSLSGKRALVTGASRGIGRAIALSLARAGADIVLHYASNEQAANDTERAIRSMHVNCTRLKVDLTHPDRIAALNADDFKVDLLVLNASLQYRTKWNEIPLNEAQDQLNCNFLSSLCLIQRVVPHMMKIGWGRIVAIGSVQEAKPHPDMLVYAASKAAQTNMVRSLAVQLAPYGITVNSVAPGVIQTDRNKVALADTDYAEKVMASIPLGFCGQPEDCAAAVLLLCADEGRYITGQNLFVDGGKSL